MPVTVVQNDKGQYTLILTMFGKIFSTIIITGVLAIVGQGFLLWRDMGVVKDRIEQGRTNDTELRDCIADTQKQLGRIEARVTGIEAQLGMLLKSQIVIPPVRYGGQSNE